MGTCCQQPIPHGRRYTEINFYQRHAGGGKTGPGRTERELTGVRFSAVAHNQ